MHRITDIRMPRSAKRYPEMFKYLCGRQNLKNIGLLPTTWSQLPGKALGLERERELRRDYWKDTEKCGPTIRCHGGTRREAEAIICRLMREPHIVLDIPSELVDQEKHLKDTRAGQWIVPRLDLKIDESDARRHRLKWLVEEPELDNDSDVIDLEDERDKRLEQHHARVHQRNCLKKRPGNGIIDEVEAEKKGGGGKAD